MKINNNVALRNAINDCATTMAELQHKQATKGLTKQEESVYKQASKNCKNIIKHLQGAK